MAHPTLGVQPFSSCQIKEGLLSPKSLVSWSHPFSGPPLALLSTSFFSSFPTCPLLPRTLLAPENQCRNYVLPHLLSSPSIACHPLFPRLPPVPPFWPPLAHFLAQFIVISARPLSRLVTAHPFWFLPWPPFLHTDDLSPSLFLFLSRSLSPHLLLPFLRYFLLPLVSPLSRLLEPAQEDRCLLRVGRVMPATATNRCPICVLGLYRYSTLDFPMCLAYSSLFPSIQSFPLVLGFRSSTFIRSGCCFYFIGLLIWISF